MVTLKSPQVDHSRDRTRDRNPERSNTISPIVSTSEWSDSVQSILDQPASILPLKFALGSYFCLRF